MQHNRRQVRRVLFITLVFNLAVALGKIVLGLASGALAITADGFHSLSDGAGNVAGLVANVYASRPPDEDHPYGHRRFETLAALLIAGLLLLTAWEMLQGALDRLQTQAPLHITPLAFGVLGVTLLVNIGVSRYQIRAGKRLKSEILLADAKNTRADVFVTLAVIISTGIYVLTGWLWVDVLAALVVVILIGRAAWQIVNESGGVLVDRAPIMPDELTAIVGDAAHVVRARSRGSVDAIHIDMDVQVVPHMTTDHSAHIANAIRQKLHAAVDGIAEIEVHFMPQRDCEPDIVLMVRARADALGVQTHDVLLTHENNVTMLEMHVEVAPEQTLADAHEQVTQLEQQLRDDLPQVDQIVTHIEPLQPVQVPSADPALQRDADKLTVEAAHLLSRQYPGVDWHALHTRPLHHGYALTVHAALPAQMTIEAAHSIAEAAETRLRGALPQLSKITIHTEPYE